MDLTKEENVVSLMRSSKNEEEWNANCDKVKAANKGYPQFWFQKIILSGLMNATLFQGADQIHVTTYPKA